MIGLPESYIYFMHDGRLKLLPHSENIESELPDKYAKVYNRKTGGISNPNHDIKVFIINRGGNKIKLFHSYTYGNNPKIIKEYVERYITDELTNGQKTLGEFRKKSKGKPRMKKCNCKK